MKATITYFTLIVSGMILFTACKKDKTQAPEAETPPITQTANTTANVEAIFNNLGTPLETFTLNTSDGAYYTCHNGAELMISPNSFMNPDFTLVNGIVTIEVKDILSKKDMILNNAFPVSNEQLLVSGGELYFSAKMGNQILRPNPDQPINVFMPSFGTPSSQMKLFISSAPANLSSTTLNWIPNNSNAVPGASGPGLPPNGYGYDIGFHDSIRWTNCDYYYNSPGAKTTCTVNLAGISNNTNTTIFISMNGQPVLAKLVTPRDIISKVFFSYANSIPIGSDYTIGAICFDGTNYFYGSKQVTMTADMVINLPALTSITKPELLNNLSTLP